MPNANYLMEFKIRKGAEREKKIVLSLGNCFLTVCKDCCLSSAKTFHNPKAKPGSVNVSGLNLKYISEFSTFQMFCLIYCILIFNIQSKKDIGF
jgi:hypothetical protein